MSFAQYSLDEWLDYLENSHVEEIQLGLSRIGNVASRLNLLTWDVPIITVAGTNGKGSTVACLEAIYESAGYTVGSYTSPHLLRFNERIRVNRRPISDQDLSKAFLYLEKNRGDVHLTYFEMTTLAALWHFKSVAPDIIILEVGLGGRLDATNIIDNDLAIITTIDFDHQDRLGDTKEAIGREKAGILRAQKTLIYADTNPPLSIIEHAKALDVSIFCLNQHYSFKINDTLFEFTWPPHQAITLPCPNLHPKAAAAAVLAVLYLSDKCPITAEQLAEGIKNAAIQGRQQVVKGTATTIFDVAHNPQAVKLLAEFIKRYQPRGKVHAVFSGLKDKDLFGLISPMRPYVDYWYPALLEGKRVASEALLLSAFHDQNCSVKSCYNTPWAAYEAATEAALESDLIIVYGSFLTVSAVMSNYMKQEEFDEI